MNKVIITNVEVLGILNQNGIDTENVKYENLQYQIYGTGDIDENGIVSNYEMISVDAVYGGC